MAPTRGVPFFSQELCRAGAKLSKWNFRNKAEWHTGKAKTYRQPRTPIHFVDKKSSSRFTHSKTMQNAKARSCAEELASFIFSWQQLADRTHVAKNTYCLLYYHHRVHGAKLFATHTEALLWCAMPVQATEKPFGWGT